MRNLERAARFFKRHVLTKFGRNAANFVRPAYEAGLEIVTLGRGVPRLINGTEQIRISPRHRYISEDYEPWICNWVQECLRPGDIVIDVGAQLGLYSILCARWVGPRGRIFAFEPSPVSCEVIRRHAKINGVADRIEVIEAAVGHERGSATFYMRGTHDHNTLSSTAEGLLNPEQITVPVVTLDQFCKDRDIVPRIVKIDTEGWELRVLQGATKLLDRIGEVSFSVEMHPYAWSGAEHGRAEFEKFYREHSVRPIPVTGQDDLFETYGDTVLEPAGE